MKGWKFALLMISIIGFFSIFAATCNWLDSGAKVIQNEFSPEAMLKKYEWFKVQSARIQKAQEDIKNLKIESDVTGQYEKDNGKDHSKWSPLALNSYQEELSLNKQQRLAQVSNTNGLIAEYNAQSAKFNWAGFKTRDDLPPQSFETVK